MSAQTVFHLTSLFDMLELVWRLIPDLRRTWLRICLAFAKTTSACSTWHRSVKFISTKPSDDNEVASLTICWDRSDLIITSNLRAQLGKMIVKFDKFISAVFIAVFIAVFSCFQLFKRHSVGIFKDDQILRWHYLRERENERRAHLSKS